MEFEAKKSRPEIALVRGFAHLPVSAHFMARFLTHKVFDRIVEEIGKVETSHFLTRKQDRRICYLQNIGHILVVSLITEQQLHAFGFSTLLVFGDDVFPLDPALIDAHRGFFAVAAPSQIYRFHEVQNIKLVAVPADDRNRVDFHLKNSELGRKFPGFRMDSTRGVPV
jgi:hypothetical protein